MLHTGACANAGLLINEKIHIYSHDLPEISSRFKAKVSSFFNFGTINELLTYLL